jgi:hypothetical protein
MEDRGESPVESADACKREQVHDFGVRGKPCVERGRLLGGRYEI